MWPFRKKKLTPSWESEDPTSLCVRLAETCVQSSSKAYGVNLDYSVASLEQLEIVLQATHEEHLQQPLSEQSMFARCLAFGAYVGELMRREVGGGNWQRHSQFGENTFPLEVPGGQVVFPVVWCEKRVVNGPEDNVAFKVKASLSMLRGEGPFGSTQTGS